MSEILSRVLSPLLPLCRQDTHSQYTSVQYSLFTSAEPHHALGSSQKEYSVLHVRLKIVRSSGVAHVSSWLVVASLAVFHEHIIFLVILPSTTTQEHEAQPVQQEPLRELPVHHAQLQAPSVNKVRHQEHSGVQTCRVAETRARQLPHFACEHFSNNICAIVCSWCSFCCCK